jgi:hypothetical protein
LPTISRTVPTGAGWAYEIKHDGFRFICRRDGDRVRMFSRRGHDWTDRVPRIADALTALKVTSITIDGEGVAVRGSTLAYCASQHLLQHLIAYLLRLSHPLSPSERLGVTSALTNRGYRFRLYSERT